MSVCVYLLLVILRMELCFVSRLTVKEPEKETTYFHQLNPEKWLARKAGRTQLEFSYLDD